MDRVAINDSRGRMLRTSIATAVAAALVGGALLAAGRAAARPVAQGGPGTSACVAAWEKTAWPAEVLLGETVTITLATRLTCPSEPIALHVVLVLDVSGSMHGDSMTVMKEAARDLVRRIDLPNHPSTRVGVVSFNSSATTLCKLTNDEGHVEGCIARLVPDGTTSISSGITEGLRVLTNGRRDVVVAPEDVREVMVVLSDGADHAGCAPVQHAAIQAKGQGILLVSVCIGLGCDVQCMQSLASSPRYHYDAPTLSQLPSVFGQIAGVLTTIRDDSRRPTAALSIADRLTPNVAYVPGSAVPPPSTVDPTGSRFTWAFGVVPPEGVTITFRVRPLQVGRYPTNLSATGAFTDTLGLTGAFAFDAPMVRVHIIPTTIAPSPAPSPVPSATAMTPATATPTPVPDGRRIVLPWLGAEGLP